jgi:hypothetical protein
MVVHRCPLCQVDFSRKSSYDYHISRKRPCRQVSGEFVSQVIQQQQETNQIVEALKSRVLALENQIILLMRESNNTTTVTNSNNSKDDTSFVTKQDTNFGLVYLIQPEELLGTNRYKLGCSSKANLDRLKSYKRNSHLLCSYKCTDPFQTENRLKAVFASKFTKVAGNEYFQGNESEMVKEFMSIVCLNN